MKFLTLAARNFKEIYRDPLALAFLLAFPLLFMLLFGFAVGGTSSPVYNVGVLDRDETELSGRFVNEVLAEVPSLNVSTFEDAESAAEKLKNGNIRAFVNIPEGFGGEVLKSYQNQSPDIVLNLTYDESDVSVSSQIYSTIDAAVREFAEVHIPVTINTSHLSVEAEVTQMDFVAPGIIIFGLLILVPTSARLMVKDKEAGYMSRLLTTPTRPWEFISGYSLALVVIAIVQIIIFIMLGVAFGMNIVGNIFLAFLVYFVAGLCSIGIGMVVAALSKSENQAEPLCWLIAMPLAVLSGVWFPQEIMPDFIQVLGDIFPFSHAVSASRMIIIRGADFGAVSSSIIFITAWAAGAFMLGIALFRHKMKG